MTLAAAIGLGLLIWFAAGMAFAMAFGRAVGAREEDDL
jgi:type IV secretory pathway TrbD component